jgi:CHAT domain-containing protein
LKEVSNLFGGETLLNADFSRERFATTLNEIAPSIIHIASHAHFSDSYQESFILAYNQKIFIDELENLIGLARFREDPIELLMLSACETAMGDERAALGLAGVAIKAGARSAIGSLWSIADEPAYELVAKFYYNLKHKPDCSKAEALRLAQIDLLKSNKYAHPRHWSPFILINNWL